MKKLLPLVLLLIGAGAGVGAGIFMRPEPAPPPEVADGEVAEELAEKEPDEEEIPDSEFWKLSNQFVVPVVANEKVAALVVLALSIEVPFGKLDTAFPREPKLRDSFLQVLFDHANMGGFEGNFTSSERLGALRAALREVAQRDLGKEIARDVLIVEIARQDY